MNRRGFLKFLGVGAVAAVAAPSLENLLPEVPAVTASTINEGVFIAAVRAQMSYAMAATQVAMLKEFYSGNRCDLILEDNPMLVACKK